MHTVVLPELYKEFEISINETLAVLPSSYFNETTAREFIFRKLVIKHKAPTALARKVACAALPCGVSSRPRPG